MPDQKLSAAKVAKLKQPGLYGDGGGLWLQVTDLGDGRLAKSWLFRYSPKGAVNISEKTGKAYRRGRAMGLGPVNTVGLAEAREKARQARALVLDGLDPIAIRERQRQEARAAQAAVVTFRDAAGRYIAAHRAGWRNAKHAEQWTATLETYAHAKIGALSVADIDTAHILKILEEIWAAKPETASRVRGRIEAILDWAAARHLRRGDNPARWRGHLNKLLPAKSRVRRVEHHAAMPCRCAGLRGRTARQAAGWHVDFCARTRVHDPYGVPDR